MTQYLESAQMLRRDLNWHSHAGSPDKLAIPFGDSTTPAEFSGDDIAYLKNCIEYVRENIDQTEWNKGMSRIGGERRQDFRGYANPLYVAMEEANGVVKSYETWLSNRDKDESNLPEVLRTPIMGVSNYAREKIDGLAFLVEILNKPPLRMRQRLMLQQHFQEED